MKHFISPEIPPLAQDETESLRAKTKNRIILVAGIILTFVPPFLWGPLVIWLYFYTSRRTALIVTNKRLLLAMPRYKGFRITEIRLSDILNVNVKLELIDNILGGCADLNIQHAEEDGPRYLTFPDCHKPYEVRRRILEAAGMPT